MTLLHEQQIRWNIRLSRKDHCFIICFEVSPTDPPARSLKKPIKNEGCPPPSVASRALLDMLIIEPGEKDRRRRLRVRRSRERAPSDDLAVQSQDAVKGTRFPRVSVRTSSCQPKKRSDERTNEHSSSSISSRDTTIIINCKHLQRVDILLTATSPFIINIGSSDYQRKVFSTVILLG